MRFTVMLACAFARLSFAQEFEASSIKPVEPGTRISRVGLHGGPGTDDPTTRRFENGSISWLAGIAYNKRAAAFRATKRARRQSDRTEGQIRHRSLLGRWTA
jgi:hypothetical protein